MNNEPNQIENSANTSPEKGESLKMPSKIQQEIPQIKEKVLSGTGCFYELTKWIFVFVIGLSLVHFFVATLFIVDGVSMEPNFHTGEFIIVNRWQYLFGKPERGDVVVLKFPGDPDHRKYIKRIIGIPGDHLVVQNNEVFLNGNKITEPYLPTGMETFPNIDKTLTGSDYFLMGDNRPNSSDSRTWGVADKRYLIGKAFVIFWPKEYIGRIPHYKIGN